MPRGNGTGPAGMGPMTGRGAGFCAGFGMPGYANRGDGGFFGRGMGFQEPVLRRRRSGMDAGRVSSLLFGGFVGGGRA